jgi:hypothetical protein
MSDDAETGYYLSANNYELIVTFVPSVDFTIVAVLVSSVSNLVFYVVLTP